MLLAENLRMSTRGEFDYGYGYFLKEKSALAPLLADQGAGVVCFNTPSNISMLLSAGRVARQLRNWRADLVHCHLPLAGIVGRVAGKLSNTPVVYTEHNRMERYHPLTRRLNLFTWNWQKRVIAVSAEVATSIRANTDSNTPVDVILNGVDTERFDRHLFSRTKAREDLDIPIAAPVVGTVAVFRIQKRLDNWLIAARRVLDSRPDAHFLVVGDGPLRETLKSECSRLGLQRVVHFTGLLEDVRPVLVAMDVFMLSSTFEGLPVALLEAMSMKCAVVATAVGGIPEVIRDGRNGLLVPALDPDALASAALSLLKEPKTIERIGTEARRTVESEFSLRRMTVELEEVYREILGNGRREK